MAYKIPPYDHVLLMIDDMRGNETGRARQVLEDLKDKIREAKNGI